MQLHPTTRPTRRALLTAGATFAAGFTIGAAAGHSLAAALRRPHPPIMTPPPAAADDEVDGELAELRRLAVTAPIAELMARAVLFLDLLRTHHQGEAILWRGAERIAEELLRTPDLRRHRKLALWLTQIVAAADQHHTRHLRRLLEQLLQRPELAGQP